MQGHTSQQHKRSSSKNSAGDLSSTSSATLPPLERVPAKGMTTSVTEPSTLVMSQQEPSFNQPMPIAVASAAKPSVLSQRPGTTATTTRNHRHHGANAARGSIESPALSHQSTQARRPSSTSESSVRAMLTVETGESANQTVTRSLKSRDGCSSKSRSRHGTPNDGIRRQASFEGAESIGRQGSNDSSSVGFLNLSDEDLSIANSDTWIYDARFCASLAPTDLARLIVDKARMVSGRTRPLTHTEKLLISRYACQSCFCCVRCN